MTNYAKRTMFTGAAFTAIIFLICKILGAVYRIQLQNMIGSEGLAYFQSAFPIYMLLMVISSAGLPAALSEMVSSRLAYSDQKGARTIFYYALITFAIVGLLFSVVLWQFSSQISEAIGLPEAQASMSSLAPLVLACMLTAAFRGYLLGTRMTALSALAQVFEQVGKIAFGLLLANRWIVGTLDSPGSPAKAASGAIWGVLIGECLALIYLIIIAYAGPKRIRLATPVFSTGQPVQPSSVMAKIWKQGILTTIGAAFIPIIMIADALMVPNQLKAVYSQEITTAAYGILSGIAMPLTMVATALLTGVFSSVISRLTKYLENKQYENIATRSKASLKIAFIVACPCAVGLFTLAKPILTMFFQSSLTEMEMDLAVKLVRLLCVGSVFSAVSGTATAILQGIRRASIPAVYNMLGVVVKVIITFILMGIDGINIAGAAFGTVAASILVCIVNVAYVIYLTGIDFDWFSTIIKPAGVSFCMGLIAWVIEDRLSSIFNTEIVPCIVTIVLVTLVYGAVCVLMKMLDDTELEHIPFLSTLNRFIED